MSQFKMTPMPAKTVVIPTQPQKRVKTSMKSPIQQGLQETLAQNGVGIVNTPVNGSSPASINIANQGVPTGAYNNTFVDAPRTAGVQVNGRGKQR